VPAETITEQMMLKDTEDLDMSEASNGSNQMCTRKKWHFCKYQSPRTSYKILTNVARKCP